MRGIKHLIIFIFLPIILFGQSKIYMGYIDGEIDLGLAPYVKRVISEAEKANADAVVFNINTFGGRVDAATQIKDAILNSKIQTIAFIDKRAISAGALISLSCQKIAMVPGASIGASTVVDQAGKKQAEKYQSYMRSEMRATAERNNRRTDIAEGMVDERVVVDGLVDSTTLITLTSKEALHYGIADTITTSLESALKYFGYENLNIHKVEGNWAEAFIRFINNPIITSLLLMIALVGFFTEIKTPGWGLPGSAAIIALILFFGAGYLTELVSIIDIIVFVAGAALIIIEIFVIPGFGIFGILGIIMMIAGLFLGLISDFPIVDSSMISDAVIQLAITFVLSFVLAYLLSKILPKSSMFNNLVLRSNIDSKSGYTTVNDNSFLVGTVGKTMTDLRPAGTAIFNDKRYDVVTEGDYVLHNQKVKVIKAEGSKLVVEKIK